MTFAMVSAVDRRIGNDDIVAMRRFTISGSTTGTDVSFNGDGGASWLRFKLVLRAGVGPGRPHPRTPVRRGR